MRLSALTPMLEVDDLAASIAFYTDALGFSCAERLPGWACLVRDDVEVMVRARDAHSTIPRPAMTGSLYFRTDDVDAAWAALKDRAPVEYPIEDFDHGMREFAIRDVDGYLLQFGRPIGP